MADKVFVIYSTTLGTATARPVFEFYTEDETHVPDTTALGYDANVTWVAVEPFVVTDTADDATTRTFTINASTFAVTQTATTTGSVEKDQLAVKVQIETLIAEWNWTQELDAKITRATQEAFAAWIEQLEEIPSNPLWATNPKGITIPATPGVVASTATVGNQISASSWLGEAVVPSQKMGLANWATLQTVWGFDLPDASPFSMAVSGQVGLTPIASFVAGRSGDRALRVTAPSGMASNSGRIQFNPASPYGFACGNNEVFQIQAWVKGTFTSTLEIELVGWDKRIGPTQIAVVGTIELDSTSNMVTTWWKKFTGSITVSSTMVRWASLRFATTGSGGQYLDIDNVTISRQVPVQHAYEQMGDSIEITSMVTSGPTFMTLISSITTIGGGSDSLSLVNFTGQVVQGTASANDIATLRFFLTVQTSDLEETIISQWQEQTETGSIRNVRTTSMQTIDAAARNGKVTYRLRASKPGSIGTWSVTRRTMTAIRLPKLG